MPNYDEATAAKMQANFQAINPVNASGGFQMQLYGQSAKSAPPVVAPAKNDFFANLGHQVVKGVAAIPGAVVKAGAAVLGAPVRFSKDLYNYAATPFRLDALNKQIDDNLRQQRNLSAQFRSGQINLDQFHTGMGDIKRSQDLVTQENKKIQQQVSWEHYKQFAIDTASTAGDILTLGASGVIGQGGARVGATTMGEVLATRAPIVFRGAESLESVAAKVPGVSKAIFTTPEGQTARRQAFNLLVSNPVKINLAVRQPIQIIEDAAKGKYGSAVVNGALIGLLPFAGGPLGVVGRVLGKVKDDIKLRAFGRPSFIDEIGQHLKSDPVKYLENLKTSNPIKYKESLQAWKAFEQFNQEHFDGDVKQMVENIIVWHEKHSNPLTDYTPEQLTSYWIDFKSSLDTAQKLAKSGKLEIDGVKIAGEDIARVGLGKFGTEEKYVLIKQLESMGDQKARQLLVQQMIADGYGWTQSPTMRGAITAAVEGDNFAKDILKIKTGSLVKVAKGSSLEFPRNYFPIFLSRSAKGYDTQVLENINNITTVTELGDVLERSVAPKGIAQSLGSFFGKLGLGMRDQNANAYLAVRRNISHNLLDAGLEIDTVKKGGLTDADFILQKLGDFATDKKSVFDFRQLRIPEIQQALGVTSAEAKTIRRAITNAYTQIPLQIRGLGDKVVDLNMKFNPFAAQYSRAQGALRYAYNPFFATQEIIETETLGQALTGGKRLQLPGVNTMAYIFGRDRGHLDNIVKQLDTRGIFAGAAGRGEFAQDAVGGGISAHLRSAQKVSIAGFVDKLAQKNGMSVEDYLAEHADEAADLARTLVQYPKKSFLNSPLAKTLSVVIFPARYNIKVAGLAAKALSQQSPLNQVLILHSLMNFGDWLGSDEGIAWQSQNAESIGLLKYFTPINNLGIIAKTLTGKNESVADYGSLGGLPFGVISTILDHQGIININSPYLNPRTGDVLPDYIPQTDKARAKTALDDLVASVFSYPGRMIGGPGKGEVVNMFTSKVPGVGVNRHDETQFKKTQRQDLTAADQHRQEVIRQQAGITSAQPEQRPNPFAGYYIPPPTAGLKPLVDRPQKVSIDAATAGRQAAGSGGRKPKKIYTARPIPQ